MAATTKSTNVDMMLQDNQDSFLPKLSSNKTIDPREEDRYMPNKSPMMITPNNYGPHTFLHDLTTTKPTGTFLSTARCNNSNAMQSPGKLNLIKSTREGSGNMMKSYFDAKKSFN